MKKVDFWKLAVNSLFAGICIAFAACLFLYGMSISEQSALERAVCSLLFGFGLYFVIVNEYKLFTGMVASLPEMKPRDWYTLVVAYLFNTIGALIVSVLFFATGNAVSDAMVKYAATLTDTKLSNSLAGSFISSVFCGMMITFAVKSPQKAAAKGLSATLCVLFPVVLFVYLGLEHCIANQVYIFLRLFVDCAVDAGRLLLFALLTAAGNVVGGVIVPLAEKWLGKRDEVTGE